MPSSKESIHQAIRELTAARRLDETECFQASYLANELHVSRSLASLYLNALYKEGLLVKVASRPALFYDARTLEKRFSVQFTSLEFLSLAELMAFVEQQGSSHYDFDDIVGAGGSLSRAVDHVKAAASYPPCGLPLMLYGRDEAGKSELDREDVLKRIGESNQEFKQLIFSWCKSARDDVRDVEDAFKVFMEWRQTEYPELDYGELMNPGVHETIDGLKVRGVRIALASSSAMEGIQRMLDSCGLNGAFEVVFSGETLKKSKPNPEIYNRVVEMLGLGPAECCCVEDSVPGITSGKAAGLYVIAKREERFGFSQEGADMIIDELTELLRL